MFEPIVPLAPTRRHRLFSRIVGFLRRHPILCLLLLSPGIPEYLSGSSPFSILALNPIVFLLFMGLNMGLYGPGVILIREAMVRWRKGWASVFLLGFAYAIVEEGLDLSTFFNPNAGPVGILGTYGHWIGVNWVWTVGLMLFHSAISIALPILLFRFAFPALKSQSLVTGRKVYTCFTILFFDSIALFAIVKYWAGPAIIIGSSIAVLAFTIAARKIPANLLAVDPSKIARSPRTMALLGVLFFPATLLVGGLAAGANAPPLLPMFLEVLLAYLILRTALRWLGPPNNLAGRTSLAVGLALPIMVFGVIASIGASPLILVADLAFALFLRRMWHNRASHPMTLMKTPLPSFTPDFPGAGR